MEAKALPKYEREDAGSAPAPSARPAVALLPAGGALWEDFLDTIGVSLERFAPRGLAAGCWVIWMPWTGWVCGQC